jgi:ATP/maltotriose-dependent transcriptional regulator MalT
MAESRPSTRRGASPDDWDVLLATKFQVPRLRSDLLARPRLVIRLNRLAARELVLISAPVGFGKTTLLADWMRTGGRPVAC